MSNNTLESVCRLEGKFRLNSGIESNVKWDIELLYKLPYNERIDIIRFWLDKIKAYSPQAVVGIPTGGLYLAEDVGNYLGVFSWSSEALSSISDECILIDDVLTTGNTVSKTIRRVGRARLIAVLVNRSKLEFIDGIPILYGITSDVV